MTKASRWLGLHDTTDPEGLERDGAVCGREERTLSIQASMRAAWPCVNMTMPASSV
jgi:hypothetical protein